MKFKNIYSENNREKVSLTNSQIWETHFDWELQPWRGICYITLKLERPTFVGTLPSYFGGYLYLILKQPIVGWIQLKQPVQVVTIANCCYKSIWLHSIWRAYFAWERCLFCFDEVCSWYSQIRKAHTWVETCFHILEVN